MKPAAETLAFLEERILHWSLRPLMYAHNAREFDHEVGTYYELWAFVADRLDAMHELVEQACPSEGAMSRSFADVYRAAHPDSSEREIAFDVARTWFDIGRRLGMKLPLEAFHEGYTVLRDAGGPDGPFNSRFFDELLSLTGRKP